MSKTICPICNANINGDKDKIVVCPYCENSLFIYKDKKQTIKAHPFSLDIKIQGIHNKNVFEDDNDFEDF